MAEREASMPGAGQGVVASCSKCLFWRIRLGKKPFEGDTLDVDELRQEVKL